jgi:hypothetical protein
VTSGTNSSAPEADFANTPVASGECRAVVTIALTANAAAERIGDLVEHQHDALLRQRIDIRRGQGIGFRQQTLMHGVGTEALVDQGWPHDVRRHTGSDVLVREPPRGVFSEHQFADMALWIGQRRHHRVPAIEDRRAVRTGLAAAPGRPAAGFAASGGVFTAAAPEFWLSIAIVHGQACVMGSE